jgi:hypothetical protein
MMYIYIFEDLGEVSYRCHCSGGLVVIARSRTHVKKLIEKPIRISDSEWEKVKVHKLAGRVDPAVYVFPDAGCC